jgi:hypothetical protein
MSQISRRGLADSHFCSTASGLMVVVSREPAYVLHTDILTLPSLYPPSEHHPPATTCAAIVEPGPAGGRTSNQILPYSVPLLAVLQGCSFRIENGWSRKRDRCVRGCGKRRKYAAESGRGCTVGRRSATDCDHHHGVCELSRVVRVRRPFHTTRSGCRSGAKC